MKEKFPQLFFVLFRMIAPLPNKTNKFIPYHVSKHKCYVIKLYMFLDLFLHYIQFYYAWIFCDIWAFASQIDFFGDSFKSPQYFNQ
jgi:hypothetical protein